MLNNRKGASTLTIGIAVVIMLIIVSTITFTAIGSLSTQKLDNLYRDIGLLDDKLELYYLKYGKLPVGEEYTDISALPAEILNPNDGGKYYKINLNALKNVTLSTEIDDTSFFIINEQSHTIYYPKSLEVAGKYYYALPETYVKIADVDTDTGNSGISDEQYEDLLSRLSSLENKNTSLSSKITSLENEISTTEEEIKLSIYPVGSIYISTTSTNPSELFGGTWESYGQGRTLIGAGTGTDSNSTSKNFSVNSTGGEYTHKLTESELPKISGSISATFGGGTVGLFGGRTGVFSYGTQSQGTPLIEDIDESNLNRWTSINMSFGANNLHNNVQPYIVTYMWKRVQ